MFEYKSTMLVLVMVVCCGCFTAGAGGKLEEELFRQKRVIGGQQYVKGEYSFHVSLWYMGKNNPYTKNTPKMHHTCGGVLIAENWVLTGATCFDNNFLPGLEDVSLWKVYLGMYKQTEAKKEAQLRQIVKIFKAPNYNLTVIHGNVALLKLDKPAMLCDSVSFVEVNDDPSCPMVNQEVETIGWGQTQAETYGLGSDVPHKAVVKISALGYCKKKYASVREQMGDVLIDDKNLCAGLKEGGVDACYGDMGSPILARCGEDKKEVVVGTVSYGYHCALPDFPAVYSRISSYYDWIIKTMNDSS